MTRGPIFSLDFSGYELIYRTSECLARDLKQAGETEFSGQSLEQAGHHRPGLCRLRTAPVGLVA